MGILSPGPDILRRLQPVLGVACAACGGLHLLVASDEGSEWIVAGMTLGAIGAVQLALAGALLLGIRYARVATAWFSLGIAVLWALSTSVGFPIGPHPWVPEAVTAPGIGVTALEFVLAFTLFCLPAEGRLGARVAAASTAREPAGLPDSAAAPTPGAA